MEAARKYSRKRMALLDAIRATKEHPSAEWLYQKLKPVYPDLSLGTVYRNLNLFRADGEIISVGSVDGQERFDGNTSPHAHFVCTHCGRVLDLDTTFTGTALYAKLSEQTGAEIHGHQLTFYGLCRDCKALAGAPAQIQKAN